MATGQLAENYLNGGKENGGGGVDFFVVNFTMNESDHSKQKSDKSAEEIIAAIEAGAAPIAHHTEMAGDMLLVNEWCPIGFFTGSLTVTFNGQTYNTREGNVWE